MELALQTYTVRDEFVLNFDKTLARIAEIGYRNIELHTLDGQNPHHVRNLCEKLKLSVVSLMVPLHQLAVEPESFAEQADILGSRYLVCPYVAEDDRSPEGYARVIDQLKKSAAVLSKSGITLCYHNHAFEFDLLPNGATGFDMLVRDAFAAGVCAELDVYWAAFAGRNPLTVMDALRSRMPLLHLKDMASGESRAFAEVGSGILNLQEVVQQAKKCGVEHLIVEQDSNWRQSAFASAESSYRAATQMLQC